MLFFDELFYDPLYNLYVYLLNGFTEGTIWVAVLLVVLFSKVILIPISYKAADVQIKLQRAQQEIAHINSTIKDRMQRAEKLIAVYKEKGIKPSIILLSLFLQIPISLSLFFLFRNTVNDGFNPDVLYGLTAIPENLNTFLVNIDLYMNKSLLFAFLVFAVQLIFMQVLNKRSVATSETDLMKMVRFQLTYILPVFIGIVGYFFSTVIMLFWFFTTSFMIIQELIFTALLRRNPSPPQT